MINNNQNRSHLNPELSKIVIEEIKDNYLSCNNDLNKQCNQSVLLSSAFKRNKDTFLEVPSESLDQVSSISYSLNDLSSLMKLPIYIQFVEAASPLCQKSSF